MVVVKFSFMMFRFKEKILIYNILIKLLKFVREKMIKYIYVFLCIFIYKWLYKMLIKFYFDIRLVNKLII